MVLII